MSFGVKTIGAQRQPILRRAAGEIILGQVRPVHRRRGIAAQHDDTAAILLPPQHFGRGESRRTSADDDDLVHCGHSSCAARRGLLALLPDDDAIALVLDLPDGKRIERRRARGFSAAQVKAGVVPGTTDAVANHEAIRKRPVIMAAIRVDGENPGACAHQQDILVADMSKQGLVGEFA